MAEHTLLSLVEALDGDKQKRVAGVTLIFDGRAGDVNAYATCATTGASSVPVTRNASACSPHV